MATREDWTLSIEPEEYIRRYGDEVDISEQTAERLELAREIVEAEDATEESWPEDTEHYTVGRWRDRPNYRCRRCRFATPNPTRIERHVAEAHRPPPVRRPAPRIIPTDRFGNEVQPTPAQE
ncbi:MAG: hypothetical protein ACODAE_07925 [Gemmatimonadota bacterium]